MATLVMLRLLIIALLGTAASSAPLSPPQCIDFCKGTNYTTNDTFFCGDERLGPSILPKMMPLSNTIYGYHRFGGLCPGQFLESWYDVAANSYNYPKAYGFQNNTDGIPLQGNVSLSMGLYVDRFGGESGKYLAPYGTPYDQRALPPSNLITNDDNFPADYHVYEVIKEFKVQAGPTASWFNQPGQGTQYRTFVNISMLLQNGNLRPVTLNELRQDAQGSPTKARSIQRA